MDKKISRPVKNVVCEVEGEVISKSWEEVAKALLEGDVPVKEIANRANISPTTIYRYLKDERFNDYLNGLVLEEIKRSEASIWQRLLKMCERGDLSAMKLYFELSGYKNKSTEPVTGLSIIDDVPNISAEEIENLYGELAGATLF